MTACCRLAMLFAIVGSGISSLMFVPLGGVAAVGCRQDRCSLASVLAVVLLILDVVVAVAVFGVVAVSAIHVAIIVVIVRAAVSIVVVVRLVAHVVATAVLRPPGVAAAAGRRQGLAKYALACCGLAHCSVLLRCVGRPALQHGLRSFASSMFVCACGLEQRLQLFALCYGKFCCSRWAFQQCLLSRRRLSVLCRWLLDVVVGVWLPASVPSGRGSWCRNCTTAGTIDDGSVTRDDYDRRRMMQFMG